MTPAGSSGTQPEITASLEKALTPSSGHPLPPHTVAPCHSGAGRALCPLPGGMEMRSKPQDQAVGRTMSTGLMGRLQVPALALVSPLHKGRSGLSSQVGKISDDVWAALGTWKALQRQPVWLTKQEAEGRALWPLCQIHPPSHLCRGAETLRSPALAIPEGRWGGGVSVRGSEEQTDGAENWPLLELKHQPWAG